MLTYRPRAMLTYELGWCACGFPGNSSLVTDARRHVEKMPTPFSQEISIHAASGVHSSYTDNQWPLELIWSREDYSRQVGQHLEKILERSLDRGECASVVILNFLLLCLSAHWKNKRGV